MKNVTDFLQKLHVDTAVYHKSLETIPISVTLLSEAVTIDNYTDYLKKLYSFVYNFEQVVYPRCLDFIPDLEKRKKRGKLSSDLLCLGISPTELGVISESIFETYYNNSFTALAGMYVLEGSTLGGQLITRHLSKILGVGVEGKMQYMQAYQTETGSMWKIFIKQFSDTIINHAQEEKAIDSAVYTFQLLQKVLS